MNLVSNDVRRFDDAMPFWVFLWGAPLELLMVFIMVRAGGGGWGGGGAGQ